jgi:heptose I phosphotransferase
MRVYFALPLREILRVERSLIKQAQCKAEKIKERTIRKSL